MTKNERKVLETLREELYKELRVDTCVYSGGRWMAPTRIGMACGKPYREASSWACRHLRKLRDRGLVRREPGVYAITDKGLIALETE